MSENTSRTQCPGSRRGSPRRTLAGPLVEMSPNRADQTTSSVTVNKQLGFEQYGLGSGWINLILISGLGKLRLQRHEAGPWWAEQGQTLACAHTGHVSQTEALQGG